LAGVAVEEAAKVAGADHEVVVEGLGALGLLRKAIVGLPDLVVARVLVARRGEAVLLLAIHVGEARPSAQRRAALRTPLYTASPIPTQITSSSRLVGPEAPERSPKEAASIRR